MNAARSSSALKSAAIFARGNPCKRVASTRGVCKNGYECMHEMKSQMTVNLPSSLGSRLASLPGGVGGGAGATRRGTSRETGMSACARAQRATKQNTRRTPRQRRSRDRCTLRQDKGHGSNGGAAEPVVGAP